MIICDLYWPTGNRNVNESWSAVSFCITKSNIAQVDQVRVQRSQGVSSKGKLRGRKRRKQSPGRWGLGGLEAFLNV